MQNFPKLSDAEFKEGVFVGQQLLHGKAVQN
jgi:hypothetical protein